MRFVDTNILLYATSIRANEDAKRCRAQEVLRARDLCLSVQVLKEFYARATHPLGGCRLSHDAATVFVQGWMRFPIQEMTAPLLLRAIRACQRWKISLWDAAIIEAARSLRCDEVLTEDLSHGQNFDGVCIADPFRDAR